MPDSNTEELMATPAVNMWNRGFDIAEHRHISNVSYLVRQTKQLIFLNRLQYFQIEGEECRKKVLKLESDCRKLRIGLRTNNSPAVQFEPTRNKDLTGGSRSNRSLRKSDNKCLLTLISKEKKKYHELATR